MEDFARNCITYARRLASNAYYSKAFDLYITAFDKCPQMKAVFEPEFRMVLIRLNEVLATTAKVEEIFCNFGRAINAFPGNIFLLNDIGKYLYKFGYYSEAWCHFQKALKIDSGFVDAEKNLNSIKNFLVERWHFRMLNDKIRNEAYHAAIHETILPVKESVLDIGTGTGLLAMYATECSPMATTAVDGSQVMTKLAECIMDENGIQEIMVVNKMSTEMDYRDIGGKRSLVVTEMFDAGLFGEHCLQTLSHAWEYLISNVGRIIPNKAEFFVAGARCDHLIMKYQLCPVAKNLLGIPMMNAHIITYEDSYDCEDVYLYKDLKYITEPQSLLQVDFNNYNDIQDILNRLEPIDVQLKAKGSDEINVVIGWFNLHLTEKIVITTDPRSNRRANAWQQAVFFDNVPKIVKENDIIDLKFLINGGKLTMLPENEKNNIMRISPETLRFLNDSNYTNMIKRCIGMACVYLGQIADISQISLVDLCPFPLFGLLMLKRGAQSLVCCAKTQSDKQFFKKVLKANKIPLSKVTVLVGDDWSQDIFRDEKYHAILCNILELCGDLDLRQMEIADHLKQNHLMQGGLFMPANIMIMGQLVSSHWLDINNRVYDENVSNYKMAMHINKYQVSHNIYLDLTLLEYFPISEPLVLGNCCDAVRSEVINVPVVNDGDANAILCWYKIELMEDLEEFCTNGSNSFIDGMAFLANPKVRMFRGGVGNILRCYDPDGSFKLMIDVEAT